jgi:hypothetical protein
MRLSSSILLFACAACSPVRPVQDDPATLLPQIRALVGAAPCTESAQCRSLALGARACGGPESYLAWSTAHTAEAPLRALAERHKQARQAALVKSGAVSDCRFIVDPGAMCRAGTCQLGSAGPDTLPLK